MQKTELAVLAYTADGAGLACRLKGLYGGGCCVYLHNAHAADYRKDEPGICYFPDTGKLLTQIWDRSEAILYISAAGIAVRTIAPFLKSKTTDPAVLCMDDTGRYVIPLLSGHLGGANAWAYRIAAAFGAEAVITTATDRHGVFAVDLFAKKHGLVIEDPGMIRRISGALLSGERVGYYCDAQLAGIQPEVEGLVRSTGLTAVDEGGCGDVHSLSGAAPRRPSLGITVTEDSLLPAQFEQECRLYPRNIYLGIGCRRGKTADELRAAAQEALERQGISLSRVCGIASVDRKKDEAGICALAKELGVAYLTFSPEELMAADGEFSESEFVRETVGTDNVCERSAVLASGGELVVKKAAENGITIAAARSLI